MQRYKFNIRSQHSSESVADFVAALRRLAEHCNYGTNLEEMLCDRIVCGVSDVRVQRRLLSEKSLTFQTALSTTQSMETADRNAQDLQRPPDAVNLLQQKRVGGQQRRQGGYQSFAGGHHGSKAPPNSKGYSYKGLKDLKGCCYRRHHSKTHRDINISKYRKNKVFQAFAR